MSATLTEVLPANATQVITHAWSVGDHDDFHAGYEVAVINITPAYARRLLGLVEYLTEKLPPLTIIVTRDDAAQYVDSERVETFEWSENRPEVTVLDGDERLQVFEHEPELNSGFPVRLGLRFLEISAESFRYRAEREHGYQDQCIVTPFIPVTVLHQIVNNAQEKR